MAESDEIWIIDTSSINQIRRNYQNPQREQIYGALSQLVSDGKLVFPSQVFDELDRFKNKNKADQPYEWAKANKHAAQKYEPLYDEVRIILADQQLSRVLDPDKDHEEADQYILAMAEKIGQDAQVGVLTEDRKSKPTKLSLRDACGLQRIVTLSIEPFLIQQGILA